MFNNIITQNCMFVKEKVQQNIGGNAFDMLYVVKYIITKGISIKTKLSALT